MEHERASQLGATVLPGLEERQRLQEDCREGTPHRSTDISHLRGKDPDAARARQPPRANPSAKAVEAGALTVPAVYWYIQ
jgi:hypothetical protein